MNTRLPRSARLGLPCALAICTVTGSCAPDYSLWARDVGRPRAAGDKAALIVGELTTLTARRLTVETRADEVALGVTDGVEVTIDGKWAGLRDLQPQQFVEIETERDGRELLASVIAARSRMQ